MLITIWPPPCSTHTFDPSAPSTPTPPSVKMLLLNPLESALVDALRVLPCFSQVVLLQVPSIQPYGLSLCSTSATLTKTRGRVCDVNPAVTLQSQQARRLRSSQGACHDRLALDFHSTAIRGMAGSSARCLERYLRHAPHVDANRRQNPLGANAARQPLVERAAVCQRTRSDHFAYAGRALRV